MFHWLKRVKEKVVPFHVYEIVGFPDVLKSVPEKSISVVLNPRGVVVSVCSVNGSTPARYASLSKEVALIQ